MSSAGAGGFDEVRVLLVPDDYRRSLRFWTDVVGLAVHETFADDAGVLLALAPGVHLELLAAPAPPPSSGRLQLSARVPDVAAAHARLARAGARVAAPIDQPWGHRSFEVVDPDGHRLTLFEVPHG